MFANTLRSCLALAGMFLVCLPVPAVSAPLKPIIIARPDPWTWTTEAWNGNDKPYRQIRSEIDAAIKRGKSPIALANQYKATAKTEPRQPSYDPQSQFRWMYAFYQAALRDPRYANSSDEVRAYESAGYFPSPHSYEFARVRFLLTTLGSPDPHLQGLGERLLKRNPKDYQVMRILLRVINPNDSESEKQQALGYAHTLIQVGPNSPMGYGSLGGVYFALWMKGRSAEDYKQAVANYNRYLELAPAADPFRANIAKLFNLMNALNSLNKQGTTPTRNGT